MFPHRLNLVKPETRQTSISAPSFSLFLRPAELPADTSAPRATKEPEGLFVRPSGRVKSYTSRSPSSNQMSCARTIVHRGGSQDSGSFCERQVWKNRKEDEEKATEKSEKARS